MTVRASSRKPSRAFLLSGASLATFAAITPAIAADAPPNEVLSEVIVTGTRMTGMTAADSAAPVMVLSADALQSTGTGNLQQALDQEVPSFTVDNFGGDLGNLTLMAQLRNLSPNHTLVLVNGKRRHGTANINTLGGGAAADLGLIPTSAISRVEVLSEGAAAQYGSDAIAGVINIILKDKPEGGRLSVVGGQFYQGDGESYNTSGNIGFKLGASGFASLTLDRRFHDHTQRGGADSRLQDAKGNPLPTPFDATKIPGYPNVNKSWGDARYDQNVASLNMGLDLSENAQLYSFATFAKKNAEGYQNTRLPNRIVASQTLGVPGVYGAPGSIVFAPLGFDPKERIEETDYALTLGAKGHAASWSWDLASTYGKDKVDIFTIHSANRSLFIDTHATPTNFYDGTLTNDEWTTNLDLSRELAVGLSAPLTFAFGAEVRESSYRVEKGDSASTYKEGGQSYPGFTAIDAGRHSRTNYGAYADVVLEPVKSLRLEAAVRHEHYSDFGKETIGQLVWRYDFNPNFALRGTVQTGFRAPSLAEEYYSATNVTPLSSSSQLPANSPAAAMLGLGPLQPETSKGFSIGSVVHLFDGLDIVLDAYRIDINHRIMSSPTLYGAGGFPNLPIVLDAIAANGNVIDDSVSEVSVRSLFNGLSTRTKGIDLTITYPTNLGVAGTIRWTAAATYNDTSVIKVPQTPAPLMPEPLFEDRDIHNQSSGQKARGRLSALWALNDFSLNLSGIYHGASSQVVALFGAPPFYDVKQRAKVITDIELAYRIKEKWRLTVGGRNIFNVKPELGQETPSGFLLNYFYSVRNAPQVTSYGMNGGYYYAGVSFDF